MNTEDIKKMALALQAVQEASKKKLDPVGKEDGDIDNDGDKDKSDEYLHARRKAVSAAIKAKGMKEETKLDEGAYVGGPAHTSPQWIGGINSKKSKAIRSHLTKMGHDFKDHGDGENNVKNNTHHISMKTKEGHAELQKIKSQHGLSQHPYGTPGHTRLQDHKGKADKADLPNHVNHDSKASYMKEEVEQIDELSSDTLKSYAKKAGSNLQKHQRKTNDWDSRTDSRTGKIMNYPWKGGEAPSKDTEDKTRKAVSKRSTGILTARGKLGMKKNSFSTKVKATESFDLSDYTVEELEDFMMSEEFEQLDELSKKTLGSYVKKASRNLAGREYKRGAEKDTSTANLQKSYKRDMGISKAVDKMTKEEVDEAKLTDKQVKAALSAAKAQPKDKVSLKPAPWDKKDMKESRWPIYNRIQEAKDAHLKGAVEPEAIDSKASKGEKDFVAKHGGLKGNDSGIDGAKAALHTAQAISSKVKTAAKRPGDNPAGDKSVIKSTEAK